MTATAPTGATGRTPDRRTEKRGVSTPAVDVAVGTSNNPTHWDIYVIMQVAIRRNTYNLGASAPTRGTGPGPVRPDGSLSLSC